MAAKKKGSPLIGRLRRAIQKVKFLLSFDATKWIVSSFKRSPTEPRRLSFKAPPTLLDIVAEDFYSIGSPSVLSRTTSMDSPASSATMSSHVGVSRSASNVSSGDDNDVNRMADRFIENFHRQLQMERQVSLQLRYLREKSFGSSGSD